MKIYFLPLLTVLAFFSSCKKENLLEDISYPEETFYKPENFIKVTSAQEVNCTILLLSVEVNDANIPDSVDYSHLIIFAPTGNPVITEKRENIFVKKLCNQVSNYRIGVYNEELGLSSVTLDYTFP